MSDEYETTTTDNTTFSPFYPLLVLLVGLVIWSGYQTFAANSQRSVFSQQFQSAIPTINQVQVVQDRYVKLMKDLLETSAKDPAAAQIVREAKQAGLLRENPNPPAAAPADAANTSAPAPAPDAPANK